MYNLIRSYLFRLDPETADERTLKVLRLAGNFAPSRWLLQLLFAAPSKPVDAFGLTFESPIDIAAGYDKDGVLTITQLLDYYESTGKVEKDKIEETRKFLSQTR
jgi:hypothetical protein